ncbi:MAG: pyridoxal phosphate-dependent aminotransferase [Solirubrobacterales bacterium]|nr:pyridoxal phosphate-dependent aminotransferase [Solirubrobacterales bacterium]
MAPLRYARTPIEIESPEELGYDSISYNLAESSFADQRLSDYGIDTDVGDLLLQYGDHLGLPRLRELIAAESAETGGSDPNGIGPDQVTVTSGAAPALFIVATALLGPGDHALIQAPNYATNLETPRMLGADLEHVEIRYEDGWELDVDRLASQIRPETKLISITYPHNPTGAMIDAETLERIVGLVDDHPTARLLLDETYRSLAPEPLPLAASLSERDRALSISSMSKTYGLPGLRMGWIINRDPELAETLLAAKEQILICGSTADEEMAARVLEAKDRILPPIRAKIDEHLGIVRGWLAADDVRDVFEWVEPRAGVVGIPRLRDPDVIDIDRFYKTLLENHGTYVGPGHWFDQPRSSFRLGFGWPTTDELHKGLAGLLAAAADAAK